MHIREGALRAYLDDQVAPEEKHRIQEHLCHCAGCQRRAEELASRRNDAAAALSSLEPSQGGSPKHPAVAFAQFQQQFNISQHEERSKSAMKKSVSPGRWKPVWIGLVVVLVVSLFVFYPPLRTAASDFLGVFRVRKFVAVPINVAALENPTFANILNSALSDQVTVVREPGPAVPVSSVDEAARAMGFAVRLPLALPQGYSAQPGMSLQDGFAFRVRVDTDYVLAIRDALGKTDVPIPPGLDGAVLDVTVPKVLVANYPSERGLLTVVQAVSPEVQLPPHLNLQQIGEFGLRLAGIPADQARQMAAAIDWANTLIVPVPLGSASYQEVTVAGVHGVLLGETQTAGYGLLLFAKDGVVYGLEGPVSAQELLAAAESMF